MFSFERLILIDNIHSRTAYTMLFPCSRGNLAGKNIRPVVYSSPPVLFGSPVAGCDLRNSGRPLNCYCLLRGKAHLPLSWHEIISPDDDVSKSFFERSHGRIPGRGNISLTVCGRSQIGTFQNWANWISTFNWRNKQILSLHVDSDLLYFRRTPGLGKP